MKDRLATLQKQGLVIEGQYPNFKEVTWTQDGENHRMEVRPLVLRRADMTVLRPRTDMSIGTEYKL